MFMDPETAMSMPHRPHWPNAQVQPSLPVYQRSTVETTTVDVGDHQVRAILAQPHQSAPFLISHSGIAGQWYTLFSSSKSADGRLIDSEPGFFNGYQNGGTVVVPYRSFEFPQRIDVLSGGVLYFPLHGSFGHAPVAGTISFLDWTESLIGGVGSGIPAIPVQGANSLVLVRLAATVTNVPAAGDLQVVYGVIDAAGVVTFISTSFAGYANGPFLGSLALTMPATAVGLVGVGLRGVNPIFLNLASVDVSLNTTTATVNLSTGLGSFTGKQISGFASLTSAVQAARVTAASVLLTNTASSLNANGYILATGISGCLPSSAALLGESSVATKAQTRTFPFVDGAYAAIRPSSDLPYSSMDSLPAKTLNRVLFVVRGQDATPVSMKIEAHEVIEVISPDPLFAPRKARPSAPYCAYLDDVAEDPSCLILCENKNHLKEIGRTIGTLALRYLPDMAIEQVARVAESQKPGSGGAVREVGKLVKDAIVPKGAMQKKTKK